jgi:hypothetical protein
MRVDYIGKSVANLGMNIGSCPPLSSQYWEGLRFARPVRDWWEVDDFDENALKNVGVDLEREDDADILVLQASEFDNPYELIVVVVNRRCLQNPRLLQWLKLTLGRDPNGPYSAQVFVPEARSVRKGAAYDLGKNIHKASVDAEATSYFPTLVSDAPNTVRTIPPDPKMTRQP